MAKDYARQNNRTASAERRQWRWWLLISVLLLLIAGFIYFYYKNTAVRGRVDAIIVMMKQTGKSAVVAQNKETPNAADEIKFDFYSELPAMQVKPAETVAATETPTPPSAAPAAVPEKNAPQYVLQIESFKDQSAANEARISLLLAGFETTIVKNGDVFYLQQGPFDSVKQAKMNQQKLLKKGISSKLID